MFKRYFFTKQTSKNKLADHLPLIIADESDNESVTNTSLDSDKENESIILKLNAITPAITNILNESFQKVDVDIVQAQEWVKMSVKCLSEMKLAENFAIFYKSVLEMVSENNIENETKNGRKRGRMSIVETSSEQQFKAKHDAVVDAFLEELNFRFKEENIRPIVVINKIISDDNLDLG